MKKYIFILILFPFLFLGMQLRQNTSYDDVYIPSIDVLGKEYTAAFGDITPKDKQYEKVKRLVAFYQWTKENPLYIPPNITTEKLSVAAKNLQKAQEFVLDTNGNKERIFPTQFMFELAKLASVQNTFLMIPSDKNARLLLTAYRETALAYTNAAQTLRAVVSDAPKDKYQRPYVFINIALTPKTVENDLIQLVENGKQIEEEISKRENCLTGKGPCQRPGIAFVKPTKQPNKLPPPIPLPVKVLFEKDITTNNIRGAYGARTACIGWGKNLTTPMRFFYLTDQPTRFPIDKQFTVQISKMVDQRFYTRLNPESLEEKILIDQGVLWGGQNETNTYMCPNLTYQPTLATIDSMVTKKDRLFPKLENIETENKTIEALTKEGLALEETFFDYPNQDNLDLLSSYYAYTYTAIGDVLKNNKSRKENHWLTDVEKLRDAFLHQHLKIEGRMENFDLLLNRLNEDFFGLGLKSSFRHFRFDPYYLYGIRSAYSLTYLTFSPFVWKKDSKPLFIDRTMVKNAVGPQQRHISYEQAVQLYTLEEIQQWYTDKEKIILDLFEQSKRNE